MPRNKKKKKDQPSQGATSEAAAAGGEDAPSQQLGNVSPKGKASFADLQEQSTLHLEADVKSSGMLKSWIRKTLLVTSGTLYICKNKSDGWSEKKVSVGKNSELKLVAPDRKNANRHQLLLTGSDRSKVKVTLDSANDQGALAKALEEEGATIAGMESITIYKAFLSSRDVRERNASVNRGPVPMIFASPSCDDTNDPDICSLASHTSAGIISQINAGRSNDDGCNIYGDLESKSPIVASNDLNDGKTSNGALADDESFFKSLEGGEESSSQDVSTNEPLYKNHEVKLYKQNLRLKKQAEIYDRLDHGYGNQKKLVVQAETHRRASTASQNSLLNSQKQSSVFEFVNDTTDDEDLYETTIQIGQHVSRLNSIANDTESSSLLRGSPQTDELSSEGNRDTHGHDISSGSQSVETDDNSTAVVQPDDAVQAPKIVVTDTSEPTFENIEEKMNNVGGTTEQESKLESQEKALKPNANDEVLVHIETTLDSEVEENEPNSIGDQPTPSLESWEEDHAPRSDGHDSDNQIYGSIDRKSYGTLFTKNKTATISTIAISADSKQNQIDDEGVGIYESIWTTSEQKEGSNLPIDNSKSKEDNKLIVDHTANDDDCMGSESKSKDCAQIKSDKSEEAELNSENPIVPDVEKKLVPVEPEEIANSSNNPQVQESVITCTSDTIEDKHNTNIIQEERYAPQEMVPLVNDADHYNETLTDGKNYTDNAEVIDGFSKSQSNSDLEINSSEPTLSLKDDGLLTTFVEKINEVYGSDSVKSVATESLSDQPNDSQEDSGINENSVVDDEINVSGSTPEVDFKIVVEPEEDNDEYLELDVMNNIHSAVDDMESPGNNDDVIKEDHSTVDDMETPTDNDALSIRTSDTVEEYDLSELLDALNDNSIVLNTNNNFTAMQDFDHSNEHSIKVNPIFVEEGISNDGVSDASADHLTDTNGVTKLSRTSLGIKTQESDSELVTEDASPYQMSVDQSQNELEAQDWEEEAAGGNNMSDDIVTIVYNDECSDTENDERNDTEIISETSNKENENASCLVDKNSPRTTKKMVRFNDEVQVQSLEDFDDEFEKDSVFSEDEDMEATEANILIDKNSNDNSEDDNFFTQKPIVEIQHENYERYVTPSPKSIEHPSVKSSNAAIALGNTSKLQQPSKVVLPALGEGDGRGKTTSSSAILLEPNAGTCLVDYNRGGRLYQRRILKLEDGHLHFFPSPSETNRRGSSPESGERGASNSPRARPVHTVELNKSSVLPVLMADGEGLYSITLTLFGGKTVLLKSPSRDEQMKLVFLLSDEVMRVTSPEDRVGLRLYPSRVEEPSNEVKSTVKLSASPKAKSDSAVLLPPRIPNKLPKFIEKETSQQKNQETVTKTHTNAVDHEPEDKASPETKDLSDVTQSGEKQLLWQNILTNKTTLSGPNSVPNKAVVPSSDTVISLPKTKPPNESISRITNSSPGSTKTSDESSVGRALLKPVPNGVRPNGAPNKSSFAINQTNGHIYLPNSEVPPVSHEGENKIQETKLEIPVSGRVSKLRSIFEIESDDNASISSLTQLRYSFSKTPDFTSINRRLSRSLSLDDTLNNRNINRRSSQGSIPFKQNSSGGQASVPEEVLGAYARKPSIVIKELQDDSNQVEEDETGLPWQIFRRDLSRRDSFGALLQASLTANSGNTYSGNYSTAMAHDDVTEAINPVLAAKRQIMDSTMAVADIRRTRDHLANRALEQWQLAQEMDEGQQLEKKLTLQQVALLQQELQQLQANLKQEKRHQKRLKKLLKQREKEA